MRLLRQSGSLHLELLLEDDLLACGLLPLLHKSHLVLGDLPLKSHLLVDSLQVPPEIVERSLHRLEDLVGGLPGLRVLRTLVQLIAHFLILSVESLRQHLQLCHLLHLVDLHFLHLLLLGLDLLLTISRLLL